MGTGAHQRVIVADAETSPTGCYQRAATKPEALVVHPREASSRTAAPDLGEALQCGVCRGGDAAAADLGEDKVAGAAATELGEDGGAASADFG